jgi:ribosome-associated heat shock protein Hsp15
MEETTGITGMRLDRWLWTARLYKTRTQAGEAINGGKVQLNGQRAKPARTVRIGNLVRVRKGPYEYQLEVLALSERRGPAAEAARLYRESEESRSAREALALRLKNDPWARVTTSGRPTKKERRDLEKFRGRKKS